MTNNIAHSFHLINKIAADIYSNTIIAEKQRFVKYFSANICFHPRLAEDFRVFATQTPLFQPAVNTMFPDNTFTNRENML